MTTPHQPDTEREAFEVALRARGYHYFDGKLMGHPGDQVWEFMSAGTEHAWQGWQASRTAAQAQIAELTADRDEALNSRNAAIELSNCRLDLVRKAEAELAEARATVARLREAGAAMANTMFNLAQRETMSIRDRALFKCMQVDWDAALSATAKPQEGA